MSGRARRAWPRALQWLPTFALLGYVQLSAAAPPSDPSGAPALASATAQARQAAQKSRDVSAQRREQLQAFSTERKAKLARSSQLRKDRQARLTKASAAQRRYDAKAKQGTPSAADVTALEGARSDYRAADELAAEIRKETTTLRKLEEAQANRLTEASEAAAATKASAAQAKQSSEQLKALARGAADEAQRAGDAAARDAQAVKQTSQLDPTRYATLRTAREKEDQRISGLIGNAESSLSNLQSRLASVAALRLVAEQEQQPGPCDIKKVDWANRAYPDYVLERIEPGAFVLRKGQGKGSSDMEYQLGKVSYGDVNGNKRPEAYLEITFPGGPSMRAWLYIYVYELDAKCVAKRVYAYDASYYVEETALRPNGYWLRSFIGDAVEGSDPDEQILIKFDKGQFVAGNP